VINNLVQGIYQFELMVTDNLGLTGKDTVVVTVNPVPNQPPVANAGLDNNIMLPTNSVTLLGSGYDPDGTVVAYYWAKIAGPAQYTIVSPASAHTAVNDLVQGIYQFELTVTDNLGATGKDTVMISVNVANQPPVAEAGPDQTITLPVNSVTLNGSGTDADGTVVSYLWTKISGPPGQFTIVSPNQAQTVINDLVQGVYQFVLKVTDNLGATGQDTVTITVNEAIPTTPPKVFPNPAINMINIQINAITLANNTTLEIYDSRGIIVYHEQFMRTQQIMIKQIDISNLSGGFYIIKLGIDINTNQTLKFIKQ
jgi:hypothetical protein